MIHSNWHKRHTVSKELSNLVDSVVQICFSKPEVCPDEFDSGILERYDNPNKHNQSGYYFKGMKIPIRAVSEIVGSELKINLGYQLKEKILTA